MQNGGLRVVLMIGIAGSGKSTLARSDYAGLVHVSIDDLKADFGRRCRLAERYLAEGCEGGRLSNNRRAEYVLIDDALGAGRSVVVDDTNLTAKIRRGHVEHARRHGAAVHAVYFHDAARAYRQNSGRRGAERVPRRVLGIQKAMLAPPRMEEGYASIRNIW